MKDERAGLPSASEYHRILGCPGMLNLKRRLKLEQRVTPDSEDAAIGTRIAAAMAESLQPDTLPDDEWKIYDRLYRQRQEIIAAVFGEKEARHTFEQRIWLRDGTGKPIFSGRYDYCGFDEHTALIIDEKSGRNDVTVSEKNQQLRSLAVLVRENFATVGRVLCAVNHAWSGGKFSIVAYEYDDLQCAKEELLEALAASANPIAPRTPGDHCKYCACQSDCPEAHKETLEHVENAGLAALNEPLMMPSENIAAFLNRVHFAEDVIEAVKVEAKRRLELGETIPGWELKPGRTMEKVTDPTTVYNRVLELGVTDAGFLSCVTVQKGALKDAVRLATGKKGNGLDGIMESVLDGCVTSTQAAPSLGKIKLALP